MPIAKLPLGLKSELQHSKVFQRKQSLPFVRQSSSLRVKK